MCDRHIACCEPSVDLEVDQCRKDTVNSLINQEQHYQKKDQDHQHHNGASSYDWIISISMGVRNAGEHSKSQDEEKDKVKDRYHDPPDDRKHKIPYSRGFYLLRLQRDRSRKFTVEIGSRKRYKRKPRGTFPYSFSDGVKPDPPENIFHNKEDQRQHDDNQVDRHHNSKNRIRHSGIHRIVITVVISVSHKHLLLFLV